MPAFSWQICATNLKGTAHQGVVRIREGTAGLVRPNLHPSATKKWRDASFQQSPSNKRGWRFGPGDTAGNIY